MVVANDVALVVVAFVEIECVVLSAHVVVDCDNWESLVGVEFTDEQDLGAKRVGVLIAELSCEKYKIF